VCVKRTADEAADAGGGWRSCCRGRNTDLLHVLCSCIPVALSIAVLQPLQLSDDEIDELQPKPPKRWWQAWWWILIAVSISLLIFCGGVVLRITLGKSVSCTSCLTSFPLAGTFVAVLGLSPSDWLLHAVSIVNHKVSWAAWRPKPCHNQSA
jgi:hypothetical protein